MTKKEQKINILQLVSSLEVGGLEKLLVAFVKAGELSVENVNLSVIVMNDKVDEGLKQELLSTKYNIYFLNRKESHKSIKYLFQLMKIIKNENVDIIHTHNDGSKYWSILCKLVKPTLKLVYTIHDTGIIENLGKLKLWIHKTFIDKSIAISTDIYQCCINHKVIKIEKIYNGVNLKKFIPKTSNFLSDGKLNIINVARITYHKKGHDILIKALKECKNKGMRFVCNFVGGIYDYDKDSFEYLKTLIEELGLNENINFLGNRCDIPELLSQSDLFVLPSRYEGMPLSLLEAMASKLPVIASNISGAMDLINDEINGVLFESENYMDLADKILFLYNNKERMENLAQNAYKYVQDFDISVMYSKYCNLYEKLKAKK